MTTPILCAGPHTTPVVLGSIAAGPAPAFSLCADCGAVYAAAVTIGRHPIGAAPSSDLVCDVLPGLRPAGWRPASPPPAPSWAKAGDSAWPPRGRPAGTPAPDTP